MFNISDGHCKSIMQIWCRHRRYWDDILQHGNRIIMHHSYSVFAIRNTMPKRTAEMKAMQHISKARCSLCLLCILFLGTKLTGYLVLTLSKLFSLACLSQLFMTGSEIATGYAVQLLEIYLCLKIMHAASSAWLKENYCIGHSLSSIVFMDEELRSCEKFIIL